MCLRALCVWLLDWGRRRLSCSGGSRMAACGCVQAASAERHSRSKAKGGHTHTHTDSRRRPFSASSPTDRPTNNTKIRWPHDVVRSVKPNGARCSMLFERRTIGRNVSGDGGWSSNVAGDGRHLSRCPSEPTGRSESREQQRLTCELRALEINRNQIRSR